MFKLILSIVLVFCSGFIGQSFSSRLVLRKNTIEDFIIILETALSKIEYTSSSLFEIFEDNSINYKFNEQKAFLPQWNEMLVKYKYILKNEDIRLLKEFGTMLGTSDVSSQINHIKLYTKLLEEQRAIAQMDIDKKSKMYRVFGFSIGLTLSLMLI